MTLRRRALGRARAGRICLVLVVSAQLAGLAMLSASGQTPAPLLVVGVDVLEADVSKVTYRVVVTNEGPGPASGVRVTDVVPERTTFDSSDPAPSPGTATPAASSCDNGGTIEDAGTTCVWDLGDLAPDASKTVLARFALSQEDVDSFAVANAVSVTSAAGGGSSDSDDSLRRDRLGITKDTFVRASEAPDTNHGACAHLSTGLARDATAFVEVEGLPQESSVERLWGAQLRAEVAGTRYSASSPGTVEARRITSGEWSQGTGSCAGAPGTGTDARTGSAPAFADAATATAAVTAAGTVVTWNVTGDLAGPAERAAHQGWALVDPGTDPNAGTDLHSSSDTSKGPKLFLVYTTPEAPTCIDADPESSSGRPDEEPEVTALVTDGDKVGGGTSDGCTGTPAPASVVWEIEADTPDVYLSRIDGEPLTKVISGTNAGPNTYTSVASDGTASVHLRLADAADPAKNSGTNRIGARIQGAPDAIEPGGDPLCGVPNPCTGEAPTEDDVTRTWSSASSGGETGPSAGPSGSPSFNRPSRPPRSEREITLEVAEPVVQSGRRVRFTGRITSTDPFCKDAGEPVEIEARVLGDEGDFRDIGVAAADMTGAFEVALKIDSNAEVAARAPASEGCEDVVSAPIAVRARVNVSAAPSKETVSRGEKVTVEGTVLPRHPGDVVVLQRATEDGWRDVTTRRLDKRSRFAFEVRVSWKGSRDFRVVGRPRDGDHVRGFSETFPIVSE